MKKLLSIVLSLLLLATTAISMMACGGNEDSSITQLSIVIGEGGLGSRWAKESMARFEEAVKDKSYAEGKKGVEVTVVEGNIEDEMAQISTSGNVLLEGNFGKNDIGSFVTAGGIYNVNEWLTEDNPWNADGSSIADHISEQTNRLVKATSANEYYAVPTFEWSGGLIYDKAVFDDLGLYIAKAGQGREIQITGTTQKIRLIEKGQDSQKIAGRDNVEGTADDGMPVSLQEFAKLCLYMKKNLNMDPFTLPGQYTYHLGYFYSGLWAALSTAGEMNACTEFDSMDQEVEYVVLSSNGEITDTATDMFPGMSSIKIPQTGKTVIKKVGAGDNNVDSDDGENFGKRGRYAFQTTARYYALAFCQFMADNKMYEARDVESDVTSHTDVQENFIYNTGNKRAFLIDGTYMMNEATEIDKFELYYENGGDPDRANQIGWYTLPFALTEAEANATLAHNKSEYQAGRLANPGVELCLINESSHGFVVSARMMQNEEYRKATKDLVQFMFSEKEIGNHTKAIKLPMSYNYEIDGEADFDPYLKSIWNMHKNSKVFHQASGVDNKRYHADPTRFSTSCHFASNIYYYNPSPVSGYNLYGVLDNRVQNIKEVFATGTYTESQWQGFMVVDANA